MVLQDNEHASILTPFNRSARGRFDSLGLAPIYLLHRIESAGGWAFHLAFWPAVIIGIAVAVGWTPQWAVIGDGQYGALLGINVAVTVLVFGGFFFGAAVDRG